jgi:Uma2 family endonuclease
MGHGVHSKLVMPITTAEELLRAQDIGRCELVRGHLMMLDYRSAEEGRIAAEVAYRLHRFARGGTVLAACGFILSRNPDTVRAPAVSFVRTGRFPALSDEYVPGAPDLAVEIASIFDRPPYLDEKVADWLHAGAAAVWVVDPRARTVAVHEAGRAPRVLREPDVLFGGDVLPGFELLVREIFAD